jgi:vacuolar-type H+-ATPase subunit I/STV1
MSSNVFELSEHKTYLELHRRLCWYGYPNYNGVELPIEGAEEKAQTLVNQPVVAKYKKINQEDDLGGHECFVNSDGEVIFNTTPIGVNTSVKVKNDNVEINGEIINTPCLFVTSVIWKRNKNICAAIKRLFAKKLLHSSWEIISEKSKVLKDKEILEEYEFEADCLLGSKSKPAYGDCAVTLTLAEDINDPDNIIAEAIELDLKLDKEGAQLSMSETNKIIGSTNSNVVNSNVNMSELTFSDLRRRLETAYRDKTNLCGWIVYIFPNENYALFKGDFKNDELEYQKVAYTVENDNVTITNIDTVKLTVLIGEINSTIEKLNSEIQKKNEALLAADAKIQDLNAKVATLTDYKELYEKTENEKKKKEIAEKQENLKQYAIKSGYISAEEIESSEQIKSFIDNVDENAIKSLIVDRFMSQKLNFKNSETVVSTETVSLTNDDCDSFDYRHIMRKFLNK